MASPSSLRPWHWSILAGLLAAAIALSFPHRLVTDGDTHMHIAVGRWIIAHHAIPFRDPFSLTMPGQEWVPHEWLAEVVFALAYAALGWGGVVALTGAAVFAAFAILTWALMRWLEPHRAAIGATLAFLLTEEHLLARPHVLALPLLALWMAGLVDAREDGRAPSPWLLPVMTLWCNLHGGFLVGLGFAGLLALEALWEGPAVLRAQIARRWGAFIVLATAAALVSPNFIEGMVLPFRLLGMSYAMSAISEWQGSSFSQVNPLEVWLVAVVFAGLSLGIRVPMTRAAMVVLLLHLALSHVRNAELLGVVAPLLVAAPLAAQLHGGVAARATHALPGGRALAALGLAGLGVFLATAAGFDLARFRPSEGVAPVAALAAAERAGITGPVLNQYNLGGFLIFSGIPVFIDGRADLYGDEFIRHYVAAVNNADDDELRRVIDQYHLTWTLLDPASAAVRLLDHFPDWERVYADKFAVVHRRKP